MRIQPTQKPQYHTNFGNLGIRIKPQALPSTPEAVETALQEPLNQIGITLKKGFDENSTPIFFVPMKENNPNKRVIADKLAELFPDRLDITDFTNAKMHEAQGRKSKIAR